MAPKRSSFSRKYRHNLPDDWYDKTLEKQDGVCAICRGIEKNGYNFSIDHEHGKCCPPTKSCIKCARGLLCGDCNLTLGLMKDNPERLRQAANYLDNFNDSKPYD